MNRFLHVFLPGRRALSALLLAHVLAVMVLAASPGLHRWLHGDLDDDHDCAVVLFAHGSVEGPAGPALVPGFVVETVGWVASVLATGKFIPSTFAQGGVFEHAPPVAA